MKREEINSCNLNLIEFIAISFLLISHSLAINSISMIPRIPRTIDRTKTTPASATMLIEDFESSVDSQLIPEITNGIDSFIDGTLPIISKTSDSNLKETPKNSQSQAQTAINSNIIDTTDYSTVLPTRWRPRNRFGAGAAAEALQLKFSIWSLLLIILISGIFVLF